MDKSPSLRVSTLEREAAVDRLQTAFLHGRLTDTELAVRIDQALSSRVAADLDAVLGDLPVDEPRITPSGARPLKFAVTHKTASIQNGRWVVPSRFKAFSYKSKQVLDLTQAQLTAARTEIRVTAYKSEVEIIVPRGVSVEVRGLSYAGTWDDQTGGGLANGPVLVIKGFCYKGLVVVHS